MKFKKLSYTFYEPLRIACTSLLRLSLCFGPGAITDDVTRGKPCFSGSSHSVTSKITHHYARNPKIHARDKSSLIREDWMSDKSGQRGGEGTRSTAVV